MLILPDGDTPNPEEISCVLSSPSSEESIAFRRSPAPVTVTRPESAYSVVAAPTPDMPPQRLLFSARGFRHFVIAHEMPCRQNTSF